MCKCGSNREFRIDAKCNDTCTATHVPENGEAVQKFGYVPGGLGVGGGDYMSLRICLDCHRVQNFPELQDEEVLEAINEM